MDSIEDAFEAIARRHAQGELADDVAVEAALRARGTLDAPGVVDRARATLERFWKVVHDDPGIDFWSDTTTLHFEVFSGRDDKGAPVGKGILKLGAEDFRDLLAGYCGRGAELARASRAHLAADRARSAS